MRQDISLLSTFLLTVSETKERFSPKEYLSYVLARINHLGFVFEMPSDTVLGSDFGDIYIELDQWKNALEPEINKLEQKFGEKFYINLVWHDFQVSAEVVPETELDKDEFGDIYGVPDFNKDVADPNDY